MTGLQVDNLRVELTDGSPVVDDVSFAVSAGEIVGLVGESGSGKTTVALAIMGYARPGTKIAGGSVKVSERSVLDQSELQLQQYRGRTVAYVPQDPASALNPARRVGRHLTELYQTHGVSVSKEEGNSAASAALVRVGLPGDREFLRRYPHQLSGGQQQLVCIAMAFMLDPEIVVLDEPTTGLDVMTQAKLLSLVRRLCTSHQVSALYVTHDLAALSSVAERVLVMYGGRLVESGSINDVFARPAHPYTRGLLEAIPDVRSRHLLVGIPGRTARPGSSAGRCGFAPRCDIAQEVCWTDVPAGIRLSEVHTAWCVSAKVEQPRRTRATVSAKATAESPILVVDSLSAFFGHKTVINDISLQLSAAEYLAVIGKSGSGKTTLARSLSGLHPQQEGLVSFHGEPLAKSARSRPLSVRRRIQYVFQSPYNSLNPRRTIGESVTDPIRLFFELRPKEIRAKLAEVLESVSLSPSFASRYPDEISGGERQRVAIARALASDPEILICDEVTSALDVSVQASIMALLTELRQRYSLALLFVTHDLALASSVADRAIVLSSGHIVEEGPIDQIINSPTTTHTRDLVEAIPTLPPPPGRISVPTTT